MSKQGKLIKRMHALLDKVDARLGPAIAPTDWTCSAFQWRDGNLSGVAQPQRCELDDLLGIQQQKAEVLRNVQGFVCGKPANHMLLWGARGTGKSTLLKAVFNALREQGLRLIEIEAQRLHELPKLAERIRDRNERFLVYCDDLSFDADDMGYRGLKAMLEGSINAPPDNLLICVTSNRRHLLPEYQAENRETRYVGEEVHPGETIEEKISLSERFGLWLSFYPYDQATYLAICAHWLHRLSGKPWPASAYQQDALQWAQYRGSRSGRVARQFAIDFLGRQAVD